MARIPEHEIERLKAEECVEHAVLEHLIERRPTRNCFSEWQRDPELQPAYDEAMLWVKRGGRSPLAKSRTSE